VNYPWSTDGQTVFYGLDFGTNVWGSHLGVTTRREAIARDFAQMAALGFLVARWFVFCDGRAGIVYDDRSLPAGLDEQFFNDVDTALEIARGANMQVVFVLFDHHWLFRGIHHVMADPITGDMLDARLPDGRARELLSQEGHDALFDHAITPFVRRYGHDGLRADLKECIFAFEFMNEPDFVIDEWERDRSRRGPSRLRDAGNLALGDGSLPAFLFLPGVTEAEVPSPPHCCRLRVSCKERLVSR